MNIDYVDRLDQQDPSKQARYLVVHFDKDEEIAALNPCDTYMRILEYTYHAMAAFLEENADDPS